MTGYTVLQRFWPLWNHILLPLKAPVVIVCRPARGHSVEKRTVMIAPRVTAKVPPGPDRWMPLQGKGMRRTHRFQYPKRGPWALHCQVASKIVRSKVVSQVLRPALARNYLGLFFTSGNLQKGVEIHRTLYLSAP